MAKRGGVTRIVRFALAAALAVGLFSRSVAHATCMNCSFDGGAGSGSNGTDETGFGNGALGGGSDAGSDNTATGINALNANTSGSDNTS